MRIGYVLNKFPVFSETFVTAQIAALAESGHEVTVLCLFGGNVPNGLLPSSVKVIAAAPELGKLRRVLLGAWLALRGCVGLDRNVLKSLSLMRFGREALSMRPLFATRLAQRSYVFDAIHSHFGPAGVAALFLRDLGVLSGPLVTTFHAYDVSKYLRLYGVWAYRALFARGDWFLPTSEFIASRLVGLGCPREKMQVFRVANRAFGGGQVADLPPPSRDVAVRIVTVARLTEKKGLADAIAAVAAMVKTGISLEYTIIGDGEDREKLTSQIHNWRVAGQIRLFGAAPASVVREHLSRAHIFLLPSVTASNGDIEGVPVSIMEAMTAGCLVVSTIHSGIPELVRHGKNGLLVSEHDVGALTRTLRQCVDNFSEMTEMRRHAQATMATDFSFDRWQEKLVDIFGRLMARPDAVLPRA